MVAISLYRGNLHKVPDVPRRWLMPAPKISLKDFKLLLNRRSRTLARLHSSSSSSAAAAAASNPNPNPSSSLKHEEDDPRPDGNRGGDQPQILQLELPKAEEKGLEDDVTNCLVKQPGNDVTEGAAQDKHVILEKESNFVESVGASPNQQAAAEGVPANSKSETNTKEDLSDEKEKRKKEVEEKLQILNEKKHNLVQALKQILNAEEELKRRINMQGMGVRPCVPLQVDVTQDSGSMSRHVTPRAGSEGNPGVDMEGGEADDVTNHNMHSRHLIRTSSTSPSSDSPHRRPGYNAVPFSSRSAFGVSGSPSRFALSGQQGHPANLPTLSVSGTNYIASSPSPAASGGTSVFRDNRVPSPWN